MLNNIPNNSMYTTIPPETPIAPRFPDEMFENAIDEHNFELELFYSFDSEEMQENEELIKHEPV